MGVNNPGAPVGGSYVTTAAESGLTNEKVLGTAVIMAGTLAARPAAGTSGRLYLATDTNGGTLYRDNGSSWVACAAGVSADYATTSNLADVAATESAGTSATLPRGDHVHAHGTGYLPNAHELRVVPTVSSTTTLNVSLGTYFHVVLTTNVTFAISNVSATPAANRLVVLIEQDGTGGRTISWSGLTITWEGGSAPEMPSAAGSKMLVELLSVDGGTSWFGFPGTGDHASTHDLGGGDELAFFPVSNFNSGRIDVLPRGVDNTGVQLANQSVHLTFFTADRSMTVDTFVFTVTTVSAGATEERVGLYTVDGSGNLTLVAASATGTDTIFNTLNLQRAAFSTDGGLPASYALVRGSRYAIGFLQDAGTRGNLRAHSFGQDGIGALAPRMCGERTGQTSLPTSITSANVADSATMYWAALET